jgi:mRNA (guanine-N7-)-methyltransferase
MDSTEVIKSKLLSMSIDDILKSCIIPYGYIEEIPNEFVQNIKKEISNPNNLQTLTNIQTRKKSDVYNLRRFHNYIKELLLDKAKNIRQQDGYTGRLSLLDISVGKGGDIAKWNRTEIFNVYGLDIDRDSIKEANRRLSEFKARRTNTKNVELVVKDITKWEPKFNTNVKKWLESVTSQKAHKFDIVSCMFALNYYFIDEKSINNVFKFVSLQLKRNGLFIGVFLDAEKLQNFMKQNKIKNKGDIYDSDVLYIQNTWGKTTNPILYGSSYNFQIKDRGDPNLYQVGEEYLVNYKWLVQLAESHGFVDAIDELNNNMAGFSISSRFFEDIYRTTLFIEGDKYFLSHGEHLITSFYSVFCFKRT